MLARSMITAAVLATSAGAWAQMGTAFTYQGRLTDNGQPADGEYDLKLSLYDSVSALIPVVNPVNLENVPVTNGLFTVTVDFGAAGAFTGAERWLGIGVRPGNLSSVHMPLTPRQKITPTPYAVAAESAASLRLPVQDSGSSSTVPFILTGLFQINQAGTAHAIMGQAAGPGAGVLGLQTGAGAGVMGLQTGTGAGVYAKTTNPAGAALAIDGPIQVTGNLATAPAFRVMTDASNTSGGDFTFDHPLLNGNFDVVLIVTAQRFPTIFGPGPEPPPVHTWFDGLAGRWKLSAFGGAPVPHGIRLHVLVIKQ